MELQDKSQNKKLVSDVGAIFCVGFVTKKLKPYCQARSYSGNDTQYFRINNSRRGVVVQPGCKIGTLGHLLGHYFGGKCPPPSSRNHWV